MQAKKFEIIEIYHRLMIKCNNIDNNIIYNV